MLQFHCDVLSEPSCDSSTGQGERASVERRIGVDRLEDAVSLRNAVLDDYERFT